MPGFFGKLPSHGDFVTRELPRSFLDVWDTWLQNSIAESKARLKERWLDVYLTSPIWRFGVVRGLCGPEAWAGIMMPSVDRVGRYFPLTIATALPRGVQPPRVTSGTDRWFDTVESLALRALDDDRFDADGLADAASAVGEMGIEESRAEPCSAAGRRWSLVLLGVPGDQTSAALAHALIVRQAPLYSLWWTPGSAGVEPAAVVVEGLPDPQCFIDLLHGSWTEVGVSGAPAQDPAGDDARGVMLP